MHDSPEAPDWVLRSKALSTSRIDSVLDVGCGAGVHLASVVEAFGVASGVGVEPSQESVELLTATYQHLPALSFRQASAHALPFDTDAFDLVMCWSALHWVGRNEYLQALGELIRVSRKHLLIMDFVASEDYRVPYSHVDGMFTYKQDFVPAILASGIMLITEDHRWWDGHRPGGVEFLNEQELDPFLTNPLSYHARRGTLFTKNYKVLPSHQAADFQR